MRKLALLYMTFILPFFMFGCGKTTDNEINFSSSSETTEQFSEKTNASGNETVSSETTIESESKTDNKSKILVAYFSATGTTRPIAEEIANVTGGDLFEIVPVQPYSEEDLDYSNDNCRANQEQNDDTSRPEISDTVENIDEYDVVFIGHPIWWGIEHRIIDTFLESYDFSGKTMVDFCTSGGSGISESESNLKEICPDSVWLEGKRFLGSSSHDDIADWVDNMNF